MSPENPKPRTHGRRTTDDVKNVVIWAAPVSLLVSAVVGIVALPTAIRADNNAEKLDKSLCAQVLYLEEVVGNPVTDRQNAIALQKLVNELRKNSSRCPSELDISE